MPAPRFLSDLAGTLLSYFRIAGIRLKNTADTLLSIRNKADSEYRDIGVRSVELRRVTGTNKVALVIGSEPSADVTFKLPVADGSTGDAITTDGSGQLGFAAVGTAANTVKSQQETIPYNSSTPVTMFTPPANATIKSVTVEVETAFDATGAQIAVGVAGAVSQYMGATDNDLATVGVYELTPFYEEDGTPDAVIITFAAGTGGSAGSARVTVEYANPA